MSDLSTVLKESSHSCFQCLLDSSKSSLRRTIPSRFGSRHYDTPQNSKTWTERRFCLPYPEASRWFNHFSRHWDINQSPIRTTLLRLFLGPANSRLTTHCRETLAYSVAEILTRLCCYCRQDLH